MKQAVKRAAAFLTACSLVYFSFIGYGMRTLPEEMSVTKQQTASLNPPYTADVLAKSEQKTVQTSMAQAPRQEEPTNQVAFKLLGLFPIKSAKLVTTRDYVIVGGDIFGIKLYTKGVLVAKTDVVTTQKGNENPAQQAGLRSGDVITEINGKPVNLKSEVSQAIENSGGTPLRMTVERDGATLELNCTPVKSAAGGKYLAGLWVRDSSAGIGTITFYDKKTNTAAGLGHAICDVDSGEVIPISGGEMVHARVMGCYKGVDGTPGELCGVFEPENLASLEINGDTGVYGELDAPPQGKLTPVALRSEVKTGPAQVLVTVSGTEKKLYDVEIEKVSSSVAGNQKNMTIRVTDPALISATGGIVQGMSGSPLLQNGMLIGAVTHVFVNSPLEGYAIFAETMLETARQTAANRSPES